MARKFTPSPLALAVLSMLHETPMHPYCMQRLIKERGKERVINVQKRQSLYQTIHQLQRAGLIRVAGTGRDKGFPERTIYRLTDEGRRTAVAWLREMLSTPAQEFPKFPAAVSFLPLLTPADAVAQLQVRADKLEQQIAVLDRELRTYGATLPRLFLLESEYMRLMAKTELRWIRSVTADLQAGKLTWNQEWIKGLMPPEQGD